MGYVLKAVLSSAQHPEYGQITVPFPIPDEKYDRMIELLEPLEIGDALRQDCRVDELDSFYTVLNRLVGSLVNFDELDYLAKRLDSFDDGEAAQFQGMACKLGVSNIKDFINLTFCCQQATVITDFSDLDAIGRQHYMTMQGGGCRIEELERLDGRKFALDLILNHLEGRITPYGVVYDNGMKLEQLYDGRHFPCYHSRETAGQRIAPVSEWKSVPAPRDRSCCGAFPVHKVSFLPCCTPIVKSVYVILPIAHAPANGVSLDLPVGQPRGGMIFLSCSAILFSSFFFQASHPFHDLLLFFRGFTLPAQKSRSCSNCSSRASFWSASPGRASRIPRRAM